MNGIVQDPHIWLDPVRAKEMVSIIADTFSKADPDRAELYQERAEHYIGTLEALHREYEAGLSGCELSTIVVAHNAFSYLADRYGLGIVAISGVSPDMEPSPRRLAEITEIVRHEGINVIFFEQLISPRVSETIARETGARTLVLDSIEGLTQDGIARGDTYISIKRQNLYNLQEALRCNEGR